MKEILVAAIIAMLLLGSSPAKASPAEAIALGDDVLAEDFPPLPKRKPIPVTPPKPGKKPMTPAELEKIVQGLKETQHNIDKLELMGKILKNTASRYLFIYLLSIDQYLGRGGGMI